MKIDMPVLHILLEPLIALFLQIFCFCRWCNRWRIKQNQNVMDVGSKRVQDKLNLIWNIQNDGEA